MNSPPTTETYTYSRPRALHDALPIYAARRGQIVGRGHDRPAADRLAEGQRSPGRRFAGSSQTIRPETGKPDGEDAAGRAASEVHVLRFGFRGVAIEVWRGAEQCFLYRSEELMSELP